MFLSLWFARHRKKSFVITGLLLLLAFTAWGAGRIFFHGAGGPPPREMLQTGLERTQSSACFRYKAEVHYTGEGKASVDLHSQVEGERVAPDRVRMQGAIMNNPVEFVQVGDTAYFKDHTSGKWISLPGSKLVDSELFYAELNPLAYFNFKDVPGLKYKGVEQVNGERLLAMELRPNLMDPFLELLLTDYSYKIWLSREDYRLRRAVIQAREKRNNGAIEINLRFWDYDKNITINPPL